MWKGQNGISSNFSNTNFINRPQTKKQGLKRKRFTTNVKAISLQTSRDNA